MMGIILGTILIGITSKVFNFITRFQALMAGRSYRVFDKVCGGYGDISMVPRKCCQTWNSAAFLLLFIRPVKLYCSSHWSSITPLLILIATTNDDGTFMDNINYDPVSAIRVSIKAASVIPPLFFNVIDMIFTRFVHHRLTTILRWAFQSYLQNLQLLRDMDVWWSSTLLMIEREIKRE